MDLCTTSTNPTGCGHYDVTVTVDGVPVVLHLHETENDPLTAEETEQFVRLSVRRMRQQGVTLAQLLNRVTHGEEATNVKMYRFFGPGAAITKTNIGTAYVNIPSGLNGERIAVDFTGCTQYRFMLHANIVGTGQVGVRVVRDGDSTVLHEAPNIGVAGEREGDTDWQSLPAAFLGQGLMFLRAQAKSTIASDDPVFRNLVLGLK